MNWSAATITEVATGFVTWTSVRPAAWAGAVTVIWLSVSTVKVVAAVPPKVTAVVPVKPEPVMTTDVPPAIGPRFGLTLVIAGAAAFGAPAAKSLNVVKPVPVAVVVVDDELTGPDQEPLYLRTMRELVSGLPTRSPGLAKVNVAL